MCYFANVSKSSSRTRISRHFCALSAANGESVKAAHGTSMCKRGKEARNWVGSYLKEKGGNIQVVKLV